MHTISRLVIVSSLLFMTVPFAACKKNQGTHVVKQVRVSATKAYE